LKTTKAFLNLPIIKNKRPFYRHWLQQLIDGGLIFNGGTEMLTNAQKSKYYTQEFIKKSMVEERNDIIEEHFKVKVNLLSVNTMRKQLFGKCRIKGVKSKQFVKSELESLCPDVIKFTVLNKKGNWDDRNGDMYDAIVAGLYKN
jgi:hypothetical protein